MLHGTALGGRLVLWNANGGEHRLESLAEPLNKVSAIPCGHHYWQQAPLAHGQHNLNPANADEIGVPVAEDGIRLSRLRIRRGAEPVEELLGAAEGEQDAETGGKSLVSRAGQERPGARARALGEPRKQKNSATEEDG